MFSHNALACIKLIKPFSKKHEDKFHLHAVELGDPLLSWQYYKCFPNNYLDITSYYLFHPLVYSSQRSLKKLE